MRLEAIELEQVGTFSKPTRISGVGPGLNVLAGANELGKSTLLQGLTALFTEQHRTTRQAVRDLRPYAGGAPFVACSFELGGQDWRLEKRFLSAHRALLQRRDGAEQHQGADAENRLAELLGGRAGLATALPLLWVGQGAGMEVPVIDDGVRRSLGQLLAAQADSTSGVGRAQAVLASVKAELSQLVTEKTGKARKNSSYHKLIVEHDEITTALAAARQRVHDAQERLDRLAELQGTAAKLSDKEALAAGQTLLAGREARLRAAQEAQRRLQQLNERVAFLDNQHKQRVATLANYDEGLSERAEIAAAMTAANDELSGIAVRLEVINGEMAATDKAVSAGVDREEMVRGQLDQWRRAEASVQRQERLRQLTGQRERLAAIMNEVDDVDRELGGLDWPDATFADLRNSAFRLEQARARQEASAPRVRFAYDADQTTGFRVDGVDVIDGADLLASGPLSIDVEGIGRIEVIPGTRETLEALSAELRDAEDRLADCLAVMGATDLADAECREQRRTTLCNMRQKLLSERDGLAPDGGKRLVSEVERLIAADAEVPDVPTEHATDTPLPERIDVLEGMLAVAIAERTAAATVLDGLKTEKSELDQRRAAIAAELRVRRTRYDELNLKYEQAVDAPDQRDELVVQVAAALEELNSAVRDRVAVQEVALPQAGLMELEAEIQTQQTDIARRDERLVEVRQEMRHIEGMLSRDFEDGTGNQVPELEDRLSEISARLQDVQRTIAALRLLSSELEMETSKRRDAIARPLAQRMADLATRIWSDVSIPLSAGLTVDGVQRGGQMETTDRISAGTREQLAVLARLAYADLLAEASHEAVPVILDDPLVFSDDARLSLLFETLADAATRQQIIVLTCHARAFEPLIADYGATRLVLTDAPIAA